MGGSRLRPKGKIKNKMCNLCFLPPFAPSKWVTHRFCGPMIYLGVICVFTGCIWLEINWQFCRFALPHSVYMFAAWPSACFDPDLAVRAHLVIQNYAALVNIRRMFCLVQLYRSALAVGAYALLIRQCSVGVTSKVLLQRRNQIWQISCLSLKRAPDND